MDSKILGQGNNELRNEIILDIVCLRVYGVCHETYINVS